VYEAFDGRPLGAFTERPLAWETVRHWVADLATELQVAKAEGTLPVLALDRVWITPDGRARLLDWPAPDMDSDSCAGPSADSETPAPLPAIHAFLATVTTYCLTPNRAGERRSAALPLGAHAVIGRLTRGEFGSAAELASATDGLVRGPAAVSRRDRTLHLAATGFLPLVITIGLLAVTLLLPLFGPQLDELGATLAALEQLEELEEDTDQTPAAQARRRALEVHVATRLRALQAVDAPLFESSDDRHLAIERVLAAHPNPSPEEIAEAARVVEEAFGGQGQAFVSQLIGRALPVSVVIWLLVAPLFALVSAVVCRGGLLLRMLGIRLVTHDGEEAGRGHAFLRAAIAWLPATLAAVAGFYAFVRPVLDREASLLGLFWVAGAVFLVGAVYAIANPERGIQDRIARTYLVPK